MKFITTQVAIFALSASYVAAMPNLLGNSVSRGVDNAAAAAAPDNAKAPAAAPVAAGQSSASTTPNTSGTLTVPGTNGAPDISIPLGPVATLSAVALPATSSVVSGTVYGDITHAVGVLVTAVGTDLAAINTVLATTGQNIFLQLGGIVSITINLANILYAIIQATTTISNATLNAVAQIDPSSLQALTAAIKALTQLLTSLGQTLGTLLNTLVPGLSNLISGVVNGLLTALAPLLSPISAFVGLTVQASGTATSTGLTDLQTAFAALQSVISNLVQVNTGL